MTNKEEIILALQGKHTADDVRKVEHGHWHLINSDVGWNDFICSVCKSEVILDEDIIYDYCPNCGAKMDGKEDE